MINARVIWVPHPYQAGFCVTDDTDAGTCAQTRAVYDFLLSKGFKTTKTVWVFAPEEKCGVPPTPDSTLRGVTLEDREYLDYCRKLHAAGFEVCLHGASAGNNRRETTLRAFDFLEREIGPSDTFICHSKNADNLYWEARTIRHQPFNLLARLMSQHACSGEIPGSPYFWGDICRSRINQVRLFKTRKVNTLGRNPSMPYFDPRKPWVNGWFSATKRPLAHCASEASRSALKRENGLCVLYQYLHHYAGSDGLDPEFRRSIDALSGDKGILVDTVSAHMERLRLVQGIFVAFEGTKFWLINVNAGDVRDLRIRFSAPTSVLKSGIDFAPDRDGLVFPSVPGQSVHCVELKDAVRFRGPRTLNAGVRKVVSFVLPFGTLTANLEEASPSAFPAQGRLSLASQESGTGLPRLSVASLREELILAMDQTAIIAREILFKGRSLNSNRFLETVREIGLENHDNW